MDVRRQDNDENQDSSDANSEKNRKRLRISMVGKEDSLDKQRKDEKDKSPGENGRQGGSLKEFLRSAPEKSAGKTPGVPLDTPSSTREPGAAPLSLYCGYYDSNGEPPEGLARRTCEKIWQYVDSQTEPDFSPAETTVNILSVYEVKPSFPQRVQNRPDTSLRSAFSALTPTPVFSPDASSGTLPGASSGGQAPIKSTVEKDGAIPKETVAEDVPERRKNFSEQSQPPAVTTTPAQAGHRPSYLLEYTTAMSLGLLLALAAYPVLMYAKDRVIAVVFQTKVRELTQSTNYIDRLQTAVTDAGMQETYRGFDPQKAVWSSVDFRSAATEPVPFPSLFQTEADADWPLHVSPTGRDSLLEPLLAVDTAMENPPAPVATDSTISPLWQDILNGDGHHLVGCRAAPEQIRGQNVLFYADNAFFRFYPLK